MVLILGARLVCEMVSAGDSFARCFCYLIWAFREVSRSNSRPIYENSLSQPFVREGRLCKARSKESSSG